MSRPAAEHAAPAPAVTVRPAADVVVPFAGSPERLAATLAALDGLALRDGDSVTVVDNRPPADAAAAPPPADPRVLAARDVQSSYVARNRGAAHGHAPWIVFLDADVRFDADLLDRLLAPPPRERTGAIAGGIVDEVVHDGPVARLLAAREAMSSRNTTVHARPYAQTANCAVRREAFDATGGFDEDARSGGDADLCFRLADAGWELEERHDAAVRHEARVTLRALTGQLARHGSGAAWLDRRYPGFAPRRRRLGLAWWTLRSALRATAHLARRDREAALDAVFDPVMTWAFEVGRLLPNRPSRGRTRASALDRWLR